MTLRRAISLVPSATDTLVALGAASALVGISSDCDQPDPARCLPVVTRAFLDPAAAAVDPAATDSAVRARLAEGGSLYRLDISAIVALAPEVVFAQDECAVCAVPSSEVTSALAGHRLACEVVSLDPVGLDDVMSSFARIGRAVGASEEGEALESSCRRRLGALAAGGDGRLPAGGRPRVLVLDWVDPPFAAGNWVPELVEAAGGEALIIGTGSNAGGSAVKVASGDGAGGEAVTVASGDGAGGAKGRVAKGRVAPSRRVTVDDVVAAAPDVVVVAPCGLGLKASAVAGRVVAGWFGAGPAGRKRPRVVSFDGRVWFSRPGPRLVDGAEALSALLRGKRRDSTSGGHDVVEALEIVEIEEDREA